MHPIAAGIGIWYQHQSASSIVLLGIGSSGGTIQTQVHNKTCYISTAANTAIKYSPCLSNMRLIIIYYAKAAHKRNTKQCNIPTKDSKNKNTIFLLYVVLYTDLRFNSHQPNINLHGEAIDTGDTKIVCMFTLQLSL